MRRLVVCQITAAFGDFRLGFRMQSQVLALFSFGKVQGFSTSFVQGGAGVEHQLGLEHFVA